MKLKEKLHKVFLEKEDIISEWFSGKIASGDYPFYCSFDIRESDHKLAPVDANMFPAGFNNICQADREAMGELLEKCAEFKKLNLNTIAVFCEEHTNNPYYWDNVKSLIDLFEGQGFKAFAILPNQDLDINEIETASGFKVTIHKIKLNDGETFLTDGTKLDFILSNNDFSSAFDSWISEVKTPSLPPLYMGWHKRRKHSFFEIYNDLVNEFAEIIDIDPMSLRVETEKFNEFNIEDKESLSVLSKKVSDMKDDLIAKYNDRGFKDEPYFFVKNSYGTYGLGVVEVKKPEDILSWNYKSRKKMKATKGGGHVSSVIIQEGIPTTLSYEGAPGEAVIYLLGCGLAGGFIRTNKRKGDLDSLNAPGAVFQRMCFSDLEFQRENKLLENVYGTIARIGALALGLEMQKAKAAQA
jgi:glutamate--cysteine ligase